MLLQCGKRERDMASAGSPAPDAGPNPAARRRAKRRREKEEAKAMGYTKATVFVGQLPYKATAAQLKEYFSHRGILKLATVDTIATPTTCTTTLTFCHHPTLTSRRAPSWEWFCTSSNSTAGQHDY